MSRGRNESLESKQSSDSKPEILTEYNNPVYFEKYTTEESENLEQRHRVQFKDAGLTKFSDVRYLTDDDFKEMGLKLVAIRELQHKARLLQQKHVKKIREKALDEELKETLGIKSEEERDKVKKAVLKTILPESLLKNLDEVEIEKKKEEIEVSLSAIGALGDDAFDAVKLKRVQFRKLQQAGQQQNKISTLKLSADIYDAVVAAAFGGVIVRLPGSRGSVPLHPIVIFIFTATLFIAQYTLLTCLLLDVEVDDKGAHRWPLVFVLNPYSWVEVKRPILKPFRGGDCGELESSNSGKQNAKRGMGDAYSVIWCLPFCFLSECFQLWIAYGVLNLSMSVILNCGKVSDVVLNGLAVTFVIDLDEYAWSILAPLLHIDEKFYEDHDIETLEDYEAQEMINNMHQKSGILMTQIFKCLKAVLGPDFSIWLQRSNGGKVQLIENFLQVMILPFIFLRQVVVFVRAMEGGTLPLTKDICNFVRMNHDQSAEINRIDSVLPFNFSLAIDNLQQRDGFKHIYSLENCTSHKFMATPLNYFPYLFKYLFDENDYQCKTRQVVLGVLIIFVLPQIVYGFARQVQMIVGCLFPPRYATRKRTFRSFKKGIREPSEDETTYKLMSSHCCDSETHPLNREEILEVH